MTMMWLPLRHTRSLRAISGWRSARATPGWSSWCRSAWHTRLRRFGPPSSSSQSVTTASRQHGEQELQPTLALSSRAYSAPGCHGISSCICYLFYRSQFLFYGDLRLNLMH